MSLYRAALVIALFLRAVACAGPAAAQSLTYDAGAAPPLHCVVGSAGTPEKGWIAANGAAVAPEPEPHLEARFPQTVHGRAVRIALDNESLHSLAAVDVQDGRARWRTVWSGQLAGGAPHCERTWLVQALATKGEPVSALRLRFRNGPAPVLANNAGVLPAGR